MKLIMLVHGVQIHHNQYYLISSRICGKKRLSVNVVKTEVIYFSNARATPSSSNLFYDNVELPLATNFKYLGFWFNAKLSPIFDREDKLAKYMAASSTFLGFTRKLSMFDPDLITQYFSSLVTSQCFGFEFVFTAVGQFDTEKRKFLKRLIGLPQGYPTGVLYTVYFPLLETDVFLLMKVRLWNIWELV